MRHGKPRLEQGRIGGEGWFRPDKDAAGRPLEGPSDRTPRGMTVRTCLGVRQNPAYRLHFDHWPLTVILPQGASYHIQAMQRHHIMLHMLILLTVSAACAPASRPPIAVPEPSPGITPEPSSTARLRFSPGTYRYRLIQTAEVKGSGVADTLPSQITTQALITAAVSSESDSSFVVIVSFDSISITTQGSIPPRGMGQPVSLDSLARGVFSRAGASTELQLPDSLCAYGQLGAISRQLLLPELPLETEVPLRGRLTDSTTQRSCRAGIVIQTTTVRELKNAGQAIGELTIEQESQIQGAGTVRMDSITVSGSVSTRGKASFSALNRLPTLIQSKSQGTITVQLGTTLTNFRQQTSQEIRLLTTEPN